MIAQMMGCFDLKMILTHGFIGSTCCFRIQIHCFAFSSAPLQMWVPQFVSSTFCGTRFFCFYFLFSFASLLRSIIWIFHVMSFCALMWIFHVMSFCAIIWIFHMIFLSAISCNLYFSVMGCSYKHFRFRYATRTDRIWAGVSGPFDSFVLLKGQKGARNSEVAANPSSWYWVHSILQVNRKILSCMKPRTKCCLRERGFLVNWVCSCSTGGRGAICDATFASASPPTPSRRPERVLFEILRQKLSCNEFPALQSVLSYFSTGLQPAFAFRYPAQHEPDPKE